MMLEDNAPYSSMRLWVRTLNTLLLMWLCLLAQINIYSLKILNQICTVSYFL